MARRLAGADRLPVVDLDDPALLRSNGILCSQASDRVPSFFAGITHTWKRSLHDEQSVLAAKAFKDYSVAIDGQAQVCAKIFVRPVCVVSGEAGTGKTTIIRVLVHAIEKAHGAGTSFQLLAPTGKAADRMRERVAKEATTIQSFLVQRDWLNDNLTFRRGGGRREDGKTNYIIDEASMVDLGLIAALFRAINFRTVQRLILVGDPNQLPPIGRGRVFSDIIDWMNSEGSESIGTLKLNVRQMENRVTGRGTGILDLASLAQTQHSCHQGQSRRLCCHRLGRIDGQAGVHVEVKDPVRIDVAVDQWRESPEVFRRQAA